MFTVLYLLDAIGMKVDPHTTWWWWLRWSDLLVRYHHVPKHKSCANCSYSL